MICKRNQRKSCKISCFEGLLIRLWSFCPAKFCPTVSLLEGRRGVALKEQFVGAKIKTIQGEEKSVTQVNYFRGNDSSKWKSNISTYDMVNLGEIYKGGTDEKSPLEKGAKGLFVNKHGELEVETELGPVKFTKPIIYQEINGKRVDVSVEYRIQKSEDVGWVKRTDCVK